MYIIYLIKKKRVKFLNAPRRLKLKHTELLAASSPQLYNIGTYI